jgi:hypothetical protein
MNYTSYSSSSPFFFLGIFNGTASTARLRCVTWNYSMNMHIYSYCAMEITEELAMVYLE